MAKVIFCATVWARKLYQILGLVRFEVLKCDWVFQIFPHSGIENVIALSATKNNVLRYIAAHSTEMYD